ncbi:MAG TPA: mannose-6-phosphate isomerase, class I, partial [Archangium sp.]
MLRLSNTIQPYAWGSPTAIPSLLGTTPDGKPQAELWLGAHPSAPSSTERGALDAVIRARPDVLLGAAVTQHFGPQLPFLLKVLAAAQPLSLQAHPSLEQAKAGFAREEAAGTPRTAAHRNYKDANHKPEVICALTDFRALCGFRLVSDTVRLFSALGLDVSRLQQDGLRAYFEQVMTLGKTAQRNLVEVVIEGAKRGVAGF